MAAASAPGGVADAACSDTVSQTLTGRPRHGTDSFHKSFSVVPMQGETETQEREVVEWPWIVGY